MFGHEFDRKSLYVRGFVAALVVAGACISAPARPVWGQQPAKTDSPAGSPEKATAAENVTVESVQTRLKELDESTELEETAKTKIKDLYQQALIDLGKAEDARTKGDQFDASVKSASSDLDQAKQQWDAMHEKVAIKTLLGATIDDLKAKLDDAQADLSKAQEDLTNLEGEPARRQARRVEIPPLLSALSERLEQIEQQSKTPPPEGESPSLTTAREMRLAAEKAAAQAEKSALENELAAYAAQASLLLVQGDIAARTVLLARQTAEYWRGQYDDRREKEATQTAVAAKNDANTAIPAVEDLASRNQQIAEMRTELVQQLTQSSQLVLDAQQRREEVERGFQKTKAKIDAVGMTEAMGALLRKQRAGLPRIGVRRANIRRRQQTIRKVQQTLFDLEEERSDLRDFDKVLRTELAQAQQKAAELYSRGDAKELQRAVRELLEKRRELLNTIILDQNSYFETLIELDGAEQRIIAAVLQFSDYIDQRILWMRSTSPLETEDVPDAYHAAAYLASPSKWELVVQALRRDVTNNPLLAGAALLAFALLLFVQRRIRRATSDAGAQASRGGCQQFRPTLQACFCTLSMAAVWPLIVLYLAWRIWNTADAPALPPETIIFTKAVAHGLIAAALFLFPLEFLRQVCRNRGLGEAHFDWPNGVRNLFRRRVRFLIVLGTPLVFSAVALHLQDDIRFDDSLGRFCLIGGTLLVAVFAHFALNPAGPFVRLFSINDPEGWMHRLRYLWHILGVAAPTSLAMLAVLGYQYTAYELASQLLQTAWLILALAIASGLLMRWVLIYRRRLTIQQARQQRVLGQSGTDENPMNEARGVQQDCEIDRDPAQISQQSGRLIKAMLFMAGAVGVWLIWNDVLPALGILNQVTLWRVADGADSQPVTLAHLALAALTVFAAFLAAKNIPGLLELVLLQRLPLDAGARYAITAVSRYALAIVGLIAAFNILGVEWSQYQWLVAAATVGLGFGLQEIFANFVSGLIILFERPIRVGDIVTIEGVTGVVSRIRMRATTVTNWDRQEYIVPNKDFVTGRLLNWTLSSTVNRVVINVGVAYGSDTQRAHDLLLQIAKDHEQVLAEPPPIATFEGFADSTLNLVLRCCLPDMENRLQAVHELHSQIDQAFRDENIEIAFPQRDLHIRTFTQQAIAPSSTDNERTTAAEALAAASDG